MENDNIAQDQENPSGFRKRRAKRKEKRAAKKMKRKAWPLWRKIISWALRTICIVLLLSVIGTAGVFILNDDFRMQFMLNTLQNHFDFFMSFASEEDMLEISPNDDEGAEIIDSIDNCDESETWAIYAYVCGSSLESSDINELSSITEYVTGLEAEEYTASKAAAQEERILTFIDELNENGMDLPNSFYTPSREHDNNAVQEGETSDIGAFSHDLENLSSMNIPENVQIVIQTGGARRWQNAYINPNKTERFSYDSTGFTKTDETQLENMGDPDTFSEFLTYCEENYPADHKVLLIWNHGGGPYGVAWDEIYGDDNLELSELREGFNAVYGDSPDDKPFDLIAFDACLMSNLDVIHTVSPFAEYFTGCEEILTSFPLDNGEVIWMSELSRNTATNGAQIGRAMTDSYIDFWSRFNALAGKVDTASIKLRVDMEVLDLSYADDVYDAYHDLMETAVKDMTEDPSVITKFAKAAAGSIRYAQTAAGYYSCVDLGLYMENLKADYPKECEAVLDALDECVLYKRATYEYNDSMGLSVYFPVEINTTTHLEGYLKYINTISEDDPTRVLYYYKIAGCLNDELSEYVESQGYGEVVTLNTDVFSGFDNAAIEIMSDGNFKVSADNDALNLVQEVSLLVAQYDEAEEQVTYYGNDTIVSQDGTELSTSFDGTWIYMENQPVQLELLDSVGTYSRYSTSAMIDGVKHNLIIGYDSETEIFDFIGTADTGEDIVTDISGRSTYTLKEGAKIQLIYDFSDFDDAGADNTVLGKEFTYHINSKFEKKAVKDGTYLVSIELKDLRGNSYYSPTVEMEIKNGKIIASETASDFYVLDE